LASISVQVVVVEEQTMNGGRENETTDEIKSVRTAQCIILHSRANPSRRDFLVKEKLSHSELTHVLSRTVQPFTASQT
jgi:hypothetical protein